MVNVVGAVDRPVVLTLAVAVDGEADYVDCALRVGRADIYLVGGVAGYAGLESNKLLVVAIVQR